MEERRLWLHPMILEPHRLWICISIEGRLLLAPQTGARPEARARELVRIRLLHHPIGTVRYTSRVLWRGSSREARHRQVETAPEKVHRAHLANEARAKLGEYPLRLSHRAPKELHRLRIVARM